MDNLETAEELLETMLIEAVINRSAELQEVSGLGILECMRQILSKHSVMGNKWLKSDDE